MPGYTGDHGPPSAADPASPMGYAGFTEATTPRRLVVPATTSVPLVVRILDSPHRPPAFVMGAHGSSTVLEGDTAPSYLEVLLAPLGAYTLLGLPMDELRGQTVDLVDVLGPAGRRLGEQLRETPSWRRRFALMDQFLLRRLDRGPRPSPEVGRAWERLVATGRGGAHRPAGQGGGLEPPAPHRQVQAAGGGWAPRPRPGWSASTASCGAWMSVGRWTGDRWRPRPAMPTRRT